MSDKSGYEIALDRIHKCASTGEFTLDLSGLGLELLPPEIGQLTGLNVLDLSGNQLTNLPPEIGQLSNLTELKLDKKVTSLPAEITKLKHLNSLYSQTEKEISLKLSNTDLLDWLLDLPFILHLSALDLSASGFEGFDVNKILKLASVTSLNLSCNQLTDIPYTIHLLSSLKSLNLASNRLTSFSDFDALPSNLTSLNLSDNQISSLPNQIEEMGSLKTLDLRENLLAVPPEILDKVNDPQVIINYLTWVRDGKRRPLSETKMLVVGQGSVGKTSLIRRLTNDTFSASEVKTDGIAINQWHVSNLRVEENQPKTIRVNIWDFGGQEIMHATHQFFLTRRSLYLLVLDARISQEENRVEYWLKIIQSFGGDSPVLIVGNKIDQHPLDIDRTGLQKKYPNIVYILETSAADGQGLTKLKSAIKEQVNKLPHVRDTLPDIWFNVKNQIESLGRLQNYISQEEYAEICIEGEIHDETSQRTLIGFLHDLGVVLHFQDDPRLEALGILNPQWVTNGVYKILNTRGIFDNNGVMTLTMLHEILNTSEYPSNKRLFIVEMMRKFELCYDIDRDKFLIPDLLPKSEPFVGEKEWQGTLAFQYHYNVLPSSVITRFIVRMNAFIHKTVWRSGVVLKKDGNTALVKADNEDGKINIWVNGDESTRRDFLSAIRGELDAIHKTIIKIEATLKVPHPDYPDLVLDYAELLQFERDGIPDFPRSVNGKTIMVNVRQLLNGVRIGDTPISVSERAANRQVEIRPVNPHKLIVATQSSFLSLLKFVFVSFPRIIGRFLLDIFGRGKDSADSTHVVLGYILIILFTLIVWKIIDIDSLRDWFTNGWRFFFPVR